MNKLVLVFISKRVNKCTIIFGQKKRKVKAKEIFMTVIFDPLKTRCTEIQEVSIRDAHFPDGESTCNTVCCTHIQEVSTG